MCKIVKSKILMLNKFDTFETGLFSLRNNRKKNLIGKVSALDFFFAFFLHFMFFLSVCRSLSDRSGGLSIAMALVSGTNPLIGTPIRPAASSRALSYLYTHTLYLSDSRRLRRRFVLLFARELIKFKTERTSSLPFSSVIRRRRHANYRLNVFIVCAIFRIYI